MKTSFYRSPLGWWALTQCELVAPYELRVLTKRQEWDRKLVTIADIDKVAGGVRQRVRSLDGSADGVVAASHPKRATEDVVRKQHAAALERIDIDALRALVQRDDLGGGK